MLADKGFIIEDDPKLFGARLDIPAVITTKKQLSLEEVE